MPKKEYFKVAPAVYALLLRDEDNEVLMLQRENTGYRDGMHSLVAGHIDGGEPATSALIREAKEEAGITLAPENIDFVHVMHRFTDDGERIDLFYAVRSWEGNITNMEPHKASELAWYPIDDLPDTTIPYIRLTIENFRQGRNYSEYDEVNE